MKKKLVLPKKETLRALAQDVESAAGGSIYTCISYGNGCGGTNNTCGEICHEN